MRNLHSLDVEAWIANARIPDGWSETKLRGTLETVKEQYDYNRPRGKFLWKLFLMTFHPQGAGLLDWNSDGTVLVVQGAKTAAWKAFLFMWFNHNNMSSIQRQLNYYGFSTTRFNATNIVHYAHPHFTRDTCQLHMIRRKTFHGVPRSPSTKRAASLPPVGERKSKRLANKITTAPPPPPQAEAGFPWAPWSPSCKDSVEALWTCPVLDLANLDYDEAQLSFPHHA